MKTTYISQDDIECLVQFSALELKDFFSCLIYKNKRSAYFTQVDQFDMSQSSQLVQAMVSISEDRRRLFIDNLLKNGNSSIAHCYPVRIEVRTAENTKGAAQIAVRGIYGKGREITMDHFRKQYQGFDNININMSGKMSFEINIKGVNKALPLKYLSQNLSFVLKAMRYSSGEFIDAYVNPFIIAADGDGTTYGSPTLKSLPQFRESKAYESVLAFLRLGGVFVIVSGNSMIRTLDRVVEDVPKDLRNRIIVVANGGADMAIVGEDGRFRYLEEYRNNALESLTSMNERRDLNMIFIGDDGKASGNDFSGYGVVGVDRSIVVCEKESADGCLKGQCIGGYESGTQRVLDIICKDVESKKEGFSLNAEYIRGIIRICSV